MPRPELVLKNGKAVIDGKIVGCDIGIENGKISAVKKSLSGEKEINCSKKLVLPGLIDVHVHFRVPGAEWKEDWMHASKAALHGGITCILDMPNNKPSTCTKKLLEEKRKIVSRKARVDFGLHFGASPEHLEEISNARNYCAVKVYMASTTGDLLVSEKEDQLKAFTLASEKNKVAMVHAEDEKTVQESIGRAKKRNWNDVKYHAGIRPAEAETKAVKQAIELREKAQNKLHFCHITSAKSIPILEKAKKKSKKISCGVTPHNLFLTEKDTERLGNFAKVNPPLRNRNDRIQLWNALNNSVIDLIETDHAPHTREEKSNEYWSAPSGIPGIETMLPLLLDAFHRKLISMEKIVECCCANPAKFFGVNGKGFIKKGFDADLVIVDLKKHWKIDSSELFTKCGWSPFNERKVRGFVEKTLVRGVLCYQDGQVFSCNGKNVFEVVG